MVIWIVACPKSSWTVFNDTHQVGGKGVPQIMEAEINDSGLAAGGFAGISDIIEQFPVLSRREIFYELGALLFSRCKLTN